MANPQYDADEQAFLAETGLNADDLTALVAGAPDVPAAVTARVQRRVWQTLLRRPRTRARSRLLAVLAASVAGLTLVGALVSTGVAAEMVQHLYRLVPGFGIAETTAETVMLASPIAVAEAGHDMQVLGLISNSAGTLVRMRWTGATDAKVPIADRPWLVLPDGTRLQTPGGDSVLSNGTLTWNFTFSPLPGDTRSVRLELPPIAEITTQTVTVTLPLTADTSGLAQAMPTNNPSVERDGVRLSVPSLSRSDTQISLALGLEGSTPDVNVVGVRSGTLEDDLGNQYRPDFASSAFTPRAGVPVTLSFQGPVRDGAKRLKLTVSGVTTTGTGQADVSVAVGGLAVGESRTLDQEVGLGPVSFRITRVTREAEAEYRLELSPGVTPEGYELRSFSTFSKVHETNPPTVSHLTEPMTLTIHTPPVDGQLKFSPTAPQLFRPGPFVIEIPLP